MNLVVLSVLGSLVLLFTGLSILAIRRFGTRGAGEADRLRAMQAKERASRMVA